MLNADRWQLLQLQQARLRTHCSPLFTARLKGLQTINRAELATVVHALSLPGRLCIHTDSLYVLKVVTRCRAAHSADTLQQLNNSDLLVQLWHSLRRTDHVEFRKIKSHREISGILDPLDRYHAYGNMVADQTAVAACRHLNPAWYNNLAVKQHSVQSERTRLKQFLHLVLDLQKARAQWDAANSQQDNVQKHGHISQREEILQFLRTQAVL